MFVKWTVIWVRRKNNKKKRFAITDNVVHYLCNVVTIRFGARSMSDVSKVTAD